MQHNFSNLELKNTSLKGLGVFSKIIFPPNSTIFEITGPIIKGKDIHEPYTNEINNYLQIGLDYYIGLSGNFDDYLNHSCKPNAHLYIVGHRAFLVSTYQINIGDEITFDYSTTSNDNINEWKMNCNCGSFSCRKIISGFQYLDKTKQDEYIKMGIVPKYLITGKNI